ncbi:MAG TPA: glycosyltransferase [Casimicrobiaceae bacterium]|nr:glycosyltransferase [Casimicrobiaceae bacterium]
MIGVVVCTRNRAERLDRCLASFAPGDGNYEIVIVDNGSEDATKSVVARHAKRLPLAYVFEPARGLSSARNRGIAQLQHPVIAFTDDDCLVAADWLSAITAAFDAHPDVAIVGGKVEPASAIEARVSTRMHDAFERVATAERVLSLMSGCNMAFRREVFVRVGTFDPGFGKGRPIGSGEDLDIMYRALRAGLAIVYTPDVVVRHAHGRDNSDAVAAVGRDYVRGRGAFYCKFIADRHIARMAYWETAALLRQAFKDANARAVLLGLAAGALHQSINAMRAAHRAR